MPVLDRQETPENPSAALLERVYVIENAVKTMNQLYELFLEIRFSTSWTDKEKPLMTRWLKKERP